MNNYRIGLENINNLKRGYFFAYEISLPDSVEYKDYIEIVPYSNGASKGFGYKNATLVWQNPSDKTVHNLNRFIKASRTSTDGKLWLTIPRNDGEHLFKTSFIDVSGYPEPIKITVLESFGERGAGYRQAELKINNLTIINEPADL